MPARSDIDAADIPVLLPYLIFVERAGARLRYRLVGTAVARALGHEPTGEFVGYYLPDPDDAAEVQAIFERVFTRASPVFATGAFVFKTGAHVTGSLLALPLSLEIIQADAEWLGGGIVYAEIHCVAAVLKGWVDLMATPLPDHFVALIEGVPSKHGAAEGFRVRLVRFSDICPDQPGRCA